MKAESQELRNASTIFGYAGNVYGTAKTARGAARIQRKLRIPTRIVAKSVASIYRAE